MDYLLEETKRYQTENDIGELFTVVERQKVLIIPGIKGHTSRRPIGRQWTLLNGHSVKYIDENTFQVIQTDMFLKKI